MEARLHRLERIVLHCVPSTLQQRADTRVCECPATVQDWLQLGRRDESCDGLQSAISETSGIWPPTCAAVCWSGVGRGSEDGHHASANIRGRVVQSGVKGN